MNDDIDDPDYAKIGIAGICNLGVLLCIATWRFVSFLMVSWNNPLQSRRFKRKFFLHLALLLSIACDIPMYYCFIVYNQYVLYAYAFHKFECALLFVAYSITISDWSAVLLDIKALIQFTLIFQNGTLLVLNMFIMGISIANFMYIFFCKSMDVYLSSKVYVAALIIQITSSLLLTGCFLLAGLKLSWRIGGVLGKPTENASGTAGRLSTPLMRSPAASRARTRTESAQKLSSFSTEFQAALRTLNMVIGTCTASIIIQACMLSLNYLLGYASSTSAYVGPVYFYWTFYSWLPLWVPVISLLYLQRASASRKKPELAREGTDEEEDGKLQSDENRPLIYSQNSVDSSSLGLEGTASRGASIDIHDSMSQLHHTAIAVDYSPRATEYPDTGFDIMYSPGNSTNYNQSDVFYRDMYSPGSNLSATSDTLLSVVPKSSLDSTG